MSIAQTTNALREVDKETPHVFDGHSCILGISHWAPETKQSSDELEQLVTTGMQGIELEKRIGMAEKRVAGKDQTLVDMSVSAVEKLCGQGTFEGREIDLNTIDAIIYFGVVSELVEPATALLISSRLGINRAFGFDVSDACMGFSDSWMIADSMIAAGQIKNALLVGAEKCSIFSATAIQEINEEKPLRDHYAALSLGDGASAVLIAPSSVSSVNL